MIAAVVNMISDVPTQADRIPARSALRDGNWLRKSRLSLGAPYPDQVDEQHGQHEQRREHDEQADDHEQLVEGLAPVDVGADLPERLRGGYGLHFSTPRGSGGSA